MKTTYYKLAKYETRSFTFKDGKTAYPTEADAIKAATGPGQYRVSSVAPDGRRTDGEPFILLGGEVVQKVTKVYPKHATRPMGGRPH